MSQHYAQQLVLCVWVTNATSFNQQLDNWNVNNVITMESTLFYVISFNQSLYYYYYYYYYYVRIMCKQFRDEESFHHLSNIQQLFIMQLGVFFCFIPYALRNENNMLTSLATMFDGFQDNVMKMLICCGSLLNIYFLLHFV